MSIRVPAWLAAIIGAIAGYLRGRIDQAAADAAIARARDKAAERTAETERGKAAALDDAELQREADTWTRKS